MPVSRRVGPGKRNKNGLQVQWDEVPERVEMLPKVGHGFGDGVLNAAQKTAIRHVERLLRRHTG